MLEASFGSIDEELPVAITWCAILSKLLGGYEPGFCRVDIDITNALINEAGELIADQLPNDIQL